MHGYLASFSRLKEWKLYGAKNQETLSLILIQ